MKRTDQPKPQRGRPVERSMPERIPDTPENILKTVLAGPPKKDWNYLRESGKKPRQRK